MTTTSGHRAPDRSEYQANGMPPGMSKYILRVSGTDERVEIITWADSSAATVVATLDCQRFMSELWPGKQVTGVWDCDKGVAIG